MCVGVLHECKGLIEIDVDEIDAVEVGREGTFTDALKGCGAEDLIAADGPVLELVSERWRRGAGVHESNSAGVEEGKGL